MHRNISTCLTWLIILLSHCVFLFFKIKNVFFLTDFGGRIDQTMSQINTLFKHPIPDHINVFLWSHQTLAWLLAPGQHQIQVPMDFVANEIWCSYVPMNGQTCVTTDGLKWDLGTWHCIIFLFYLSKHLMTYQFNTHYLYFFCNSEFIGWIWWHNKLIEYI